MMSDSGFCCFPIDIAVRLIGTISLLTHALILIVLVSDSEEVLSDERIRIIFGFDSKLFFNDLSDDIDWFAIFCLIYTVVAAFSSSLLIWASIIGRRWLTVPWLICSFVNIIGHFASLILVSFTSLSTDEDKWITAFTVFYSVGLLYFIIIVMAANYIWGAQSKELLTLRNQELWENVYKSPPLFESAYKNQV